MEIGFIGLGAMGGAMARNLIDADYSVRVHDLDDDAQASVVEAGGVPGESAADVADRSDVVFLSLPTPDIVETVVLGEAGVGQALQPGAVLVDASTSRPDLTRDIATVLAERDVDVLSAPVSGGPSGAQAGELSMMVGGPRSSYERTEPLLETLASGVIYVGPEPSHGHALKLVNNYLKFASMVSAAEAFVIGQSAGIDLETQLNVVNASSGRSGSTESTYPSFVEPGTFDSGFSMQLMNKDMGLFAEWAADSDVPLPVANAIQQHLELIERFEGSDVDYTRMYSFYESLRNA
jgi:3-hydroxyisobutyrate dehydrogenase-like beta-hydroxyacid dehydrogenase